jgi:hypothetical protein
MQSRDSQGHLQTIREQTARGSRNSRALVTNTTPYEKPGQVTRPGSPGGVNGYRPRSRECSRCPWLLQALRAPDTGSIIMTNAVVCSPGIEAYAIYALPAAVCDVVDPHRLIAVHSAHSKTPGQVFARSGGRGSRPWHQINTIARCYEPAVMRTVSRHPGDLVSGHLETLHDTIATNRPTPKYPKAKIARASRAKTMSFMAKTSHPAATAPSSP